MFHVTEEIRGLSYNLHTGLISSVTSQKVISHFGSWEYWRYSMMPSFFGFCIFVVFPFQKLVLIKFFLQLSFWSALNYHCTRKTPRSLSHQSKLLTSFSKYILFRQIIRSSDLSIHMYCAHVNNNQPPCTLKSSHLYI